MKAKKVIMLTLLAMLLVSTVACGAASSAGQSHVERGNEHLGAKQWDQAITEYTAALELDPELVEAYFNRARAYGEKGELDLAIADCDKAIDLDPNLAEPYNNRAVAYAKMGQYDQAIADLTSAINIDPSCEMCHCNRGYCYAQQEKKAEAISDLEQCIAVSHDPAVIKMANELLQVLRE